MQVLNAIEGLVATHQVEAIYRTGETSDWYVVFETAEETDQYGTGETRFLDNDYKVTIDRIDRRRVNLRVHWFPMYMNKDLVEGYFGEYGTHVTTEYATVDLDGILVKTGIIDITMVVTAQAYDSIPYKTAIYGRNILVTIAGRIPECLKCGERGHTRSDCPQGYRANRGNRDGRGDRNGRDDRPGSYAGAVIHGSSGESTTVVADVTAVDAEEPRSSSSEGTREGIEVQISSSEGTPPGAEVLNRSEDAQEGVDGLTSSEVTPPQGDEVLDSSEVTQEGGDVLGSNRKRNKDGEDKDEDENKKRKEDLGDEVEMHIHVKPFPLNLGLKPPLADFISTPDNLFTMDDGMHV